MNLSIFKFILIYNTVTYYATFIIRFTIYSHSKLIYFRENLLVKLYFILLLFISKKNNLDNVSTPVLARLFELLRPAREKTRSTGDFEA